MDQPAVGESIRADFIDDSSPISAFIENYCEVDPEYSEEKAIFRHALNLWLEQAGHKPMADSTISRQIRANNSRIDTDRKCRVDGKPKTIFVGIGLNADGRALNIISDFRSGLVQKGGRPQSLPQPATTHRKALTIRKGLTTVSSSHHSRIVPVVLAPLIGCHHALIQFDGAPKVDFRSADREGDLTDSVVLEPPAGMACRI